MKQSTAILLVLASLLKPTSTLVFVEKSEWSIVSSSPSNSFLFVQLPEEIASTIASLDTIDDQIFESVKSQFLVTDDGNNIQTWQDGSYTVSKVIISKPHFEARRGVFVKVTSEGPQEGFKGRLFLQPTTLRSGGTGRTLSQITGEDYHEFEFRANWKNSDLHQRVSYQIFKWLNRILIILKLYIIFVRPVLKNTHKIPVAWFASSVISMQLLYLIPFLNGHYGGVIDKIHFGILDAVYNKYGLDLSAAYLDSKWTGLTSYTYMGNFDYEISKFVGNPILANYADLFMLVFSLVFVRFNGVLRNSRLVYLSKSLKSGVVMVTAVPLVLESYSCVFYVISAGKFSSVRDVLYCILSFALLIILACELWKLCSSPDGYKSQNSLHEIGLVEFDCHSRTQLHKIFKIGEILLSLLIPVIVFSFANHTTTSKIILIFVFTLISISNGIKASANRWRKDIQVINILKVAENLAKILMIILLTIIDFSEGISLESIRVTSWLYLILLISNILLNFFILVDRIFYESNKIYRWSLKEAKYPEQPRTLIDAEKALRSIGKGKEGRQASVKIKKNQVGEMVKGDSSDRGMTKITEKQYLKGPDKKKRQILDEQESIESANSEMMNFKSR